MLERKQQDDELRPIGQEERDPVPRLHTEVRQPCGHAGGLVGHLLPAHAPLAAHQGLLGALATGRVGQQVVKTAWTLGKAGHDPVSEMGFAPDFRQIEIGPPVDGHDRTVLVHGES